MRQIYFLALAGSIIISCNNPNKHTQEKPQDVPVVAVRSTQIRMDRLYVSDIQAVRNVEIRSKISGFLDGIFVDEGQTVKKGQVLFKIGDAEYRADIAKAKAALNNVKAEAHIAEVESDRVRLMVDKKIISQTELELALSKVKAAKARIEEAESAVQHAQHRLSYTVVCAPFDGVIDRIPLKSGSLVSEGTLITSESDISSMYAYFNISENEYLALNRNHDSGSINHKAIHLILSDGQEYAHEGKIETVVSEFNESTGSISVRARFANPAHLLKHKATGKVRLTSPAEQMLIVPQKVAFEIQDKNYVYLVGKDNVVRMKSFEPAGRIDQYYIVGSGLRQGDRIIYEGIQNLKEGMKVAPHMTVDSDTPVASH